MAQYSMTPVDATLTTSAVLIHTVPGTKEQTITITFTNYIVGDVQVKLWIVKNGDTRGDQHLYLGNFTIPGGEPRNGPEHVSLPPNTAIHALASAATSVAMHITGIERLV